MMTVIATTTSGETTAQFGNKKMTKDNVHGKNHNLGEIDLHLQCGDKDKNQLIDSEGQSDHSTIMRRTYQMQSEDNLKICSRLSERSRTLQRKREQEARQVQRGTLDKDQIETITWTTIEIKTTIGHELIKDNSDKWQALEEMTDTTTRGPNHTE